MKNQPITFSTNQNITLHIKRDDLLHPFVSGNKFRKLKYNLFQAKVEQRKTLITFGGAFSNHIAAVAFAAKENGFESIGIIRGDEIADKREDNPTLKFAKEHGMRLEFVSREIYREKEQSHVFKKITLLTEDFFIIPEGGTNILAVKGCEEIITSDDHKYDYICCAVGTGGTISGIINASAAHQKVLGFPALKGDFLKKDIRKFATNNNWELIERYHFGGYAKINTELIEFINNFYLNTKIPLDPVYTGKLLFGVMDLLQNGYFDANSKVLVIHTGGLQGIQGMNKSLIKKGLKKINIDV